MTTAVVPGTFDPITSGHLDIIERAAHLFDEVIVGVAASEHKNGTGPLFTADQRVGLIQEATAHLNNIRVAPFETLLIDFVRAQGGDVIVKGLRAMTDFEHEFQMAALNGRMNSEVETLFIMSAPEFMYLSSSAVKEIAALGGPVNGLVPNCVEKALRNGF
ncbi:MAG: pantetheine-phosphate adenylyltransferase [Coriobacteriia bacterium]|nr:pantetheine-phosphate adenylyltransferase [Coriobacteriia bacterium]